MMIRFNRREFFKLNSWRKYVHMFTYPIKKFSIDLFNQHKKFKVNAIININKTEFNFLRKFKELQNI